MKHLRSNYSNKELDVNVRLPKDFEFKILGKLVRDLEDVVAETYMESSVKQHIANDLKLVSDCVRSKDIQGIQRITDLLSTQSMLTQKDLIQGDSKNAFAFYVSYQLGAFLKKFPFKGTDTRTPAIDSFIKAEKVCRRFNNENYKALLKMDSTNHSIFCGCLDEIRRDIENLIGSVPDIDSVKEHATHGPGVSLGPEYKGGRCTSYFKWSTLPYSVTSEALPLAQELIESDPRWYGALDHWYRVRCGNLYRPIDLSDFWSRVFSVKNSSRITTVPKSGLTDRTIAIEPLMNVMLQLGVDKYFKKRLKACWGYDLTSQLLNQQLAELGAREGSYATLDLKAASDTVSLKICELLLPPLWFDLLCTLRCRKGMLDGVEGSFDKISSMGNGFTFALESLVFGALVRHVQRRLGDQRVTAVFGDDLVVPVESARPLIELLQYSGFDLNMEKSFIDGPFRESCGSDWFSRYNVRPLFLKKSIRTVMDLFYVHNRLFELEENLEWGWNMHFEQTRRFLRKYIPSNFASFCGPPSESQDTYLFTHTKFRGTGNVKFLRAIIARPNKLRNKSDFYFRRLMASLKGAPVQYQSWDKKRLLSSGNVFDITLRDDVSYYETKIQYSW
jgi:hypothetical protein